MIQNFRGSSLNKNMKKNLLILKEKRSKLDIEQREKLIEKSHRWDNFRERRTEIVEKYIS